VKHAKPPTAIAILFLDRKDGSWACDLNGEGDGEEEWREQNQAIVAPITSTKRFAASAVSRFYF